VAAPPLTSKRRESCNCDMHELNYPRDHQGHESRKTGHKTRCHDEKPDDQSHDDGNPVLPQKPAAVQFEPPYPNRQPVSLSLIVLQAPLDLSYSRGSAG
jgi:hypothetical protein